jgi:hypothetical protein
MDAVRRGNPEAERPPGAQLSINLPSCAKLRITTKAQLIYTALLLVEWTTLAVIYQCIDKFASRCFWPLRHSYAPKF